VAKPEWGTKRMCQSCGTRYYDLRRDPPVCPKCETVFAVRTSTRQRRGAAAAPVEVAEEKPAAKKEKVKKVEAVADENVEAIAEEAVAKESEDTEVLDSDDEDDSLMEDASELGEDEDDVSEVMEHLEDEDLSDRS